MAKDFRAMLCNCLDIPTSSDDETLQSAYDEQCEAAEPAPEPTESDEQAPTQAAEPPDTVDIQANSPKAKGEYKSRAMRSLSR